MTIDSPEAGLFYARNLVFKPVSLHIFDSEELRDQWLEGGLFRSVLFPSEDRWHGISPEIRAACAAWVLEGRVEWPDTLEPYVIIDHRPDDAPGDFEYFMLLAQIKSA